MNENEEFILLAGNSIKFSNKFGYSLAIKLADNEVRINQAELSELINFLIEQRDRIDKNMFDKVNSYSK